MPETKHISLVKPLDTETAQLTATTTADAEAAALAAGDAAEAFIGEKRLGERIKALRLKKSMGLVELGRHTGLSASFLSQRFDDFEPLGAIR